MWLVKKEIIQMIHKIITKIRNKLFGFDPNVLLLTNYNQKRFLLEQNILYSNEVGVTNTKYCESDIIVSLTTYGKRIYDVALTIESIMEQTMKANKIVLWLDYSFQNKTLPNSLNKLKNRGLEICFCEDLLSYKKLIPTQKKYPNDVIITIDDDILYDYDVIERLLSSYPKEPNYIHCLRHHRMKFDKCGNLLPYIKWILEDKNDSLTFLNFFTSGAGTLFPPNSLDSNVTDEKSFLSICKYADDIWLNAMAILKGTLTKQCYTRNKNCMEGLVNEDVQDIALANNNVTLGRNDIQIKAVFEKYGIYALIKQSVNI